MEHDFDNLTKEIKRLEKRNAIEAELNMPMNRPIVGKPMVEDENEKKGRASKNYKKSFWNVMRQKACPS